MHSQSGSIIIQFEMRIDCFKISPNSIFNKIKMSGLLNEGVGNWLEIFFFNIFFVVNQNKIRLNLQTGVLCILCTSNCKELVTQTNQQFIDQLSYKEKRNQK